MDFVHSMEAEYGRPAKDFVTQSFRECPTVTSMAVVFSLIAFVPVVSAIALALLTCIIAVAGAFIAVATLATGALIAVATLTLFLSIVLSAAFVLSVVASLVMSGGISFRRSLPETQEAIPTAAESPGISKYRELLARTFVALNITAHILGHPLKSTGWRAHLIAAILFRNIFARIFLPRWMRYHPFYPYIFGRSRTPHSLKWVLSRHISRVISVASFFFKFWHLAHRILSDVGWDSVLAACVLLLFISPRARSLGYAALMAPFVFFRAKVEPSWRRVRSVYAAVASLAGAPFFRVIPQSQENAVITEPDPAANVEVSATDDMRDETALHASVLQDQGAATTVVSTCGGIVEGEMVPQAFVLPGHDAVTTAVSTCRGIVQTLRARNVSEEEKED